MSVHFPSLCLWVHQPVWGFIDQLHEGLGVHNVYPALSCYYLLQAWPGVCVGISLMSTSLCAKGEADWSYEVYLLWEQVPTYFGRACKHERELCCVTGHQHVLFSGCSVSVSFVDKPWSCAHVHVRGVSSPLSLHVTMSCHNTINEMQTRRCVRNTSRFFWSQLIILCIP